MLTITQPCLWASPWPFSHEQLFDNIVKIWQYNRVSLFYGYTVKSYLYIHVTMASVFPQEIECLNQKLSFLHKRMQASHSDQTIINTSSYCHFSFSCKHLRNIHKGFNISFKSLRCFCIRCVSYCTFFCFVFAHTSLFCRRLQTLAAGRGCWAEPLCGKQKPTFLSVIEEKKPSSLQMLSPYEDGWGPWFLPFIFIKRVQWCGF